MPDIVTSRFSGFADTYDRARPRPPAAIAKLLLDTIGADRADTVVDIGCGTGLSTVIWAGHARHILGIEPNDDMRRQAESGDAKPGVRYVAATSYDTGLENESVDIITCSQSFHWMEPVATLNECSRILKPGGVFAAYDNDWPPFVSPACDRAYTELFARVRAFTAAHNDKLPRENAYDKAKHLENIRGRAAFAWARELLLHSTETCDAERFVAIALSQGSLQTLVKNGISAIDEHLERFTEAVRKAFTGGLSRTMWVGYRLRMGVKAPTGLNRT